MHREGSKMGPLASNGIRKNYNQANRTVVKRPRVGQNGTELKHGRGKLRGGEAGGPEKHLLGVLGASGVAVLEPQIKRKSKGGGKGSTNCKTAGGAVFCKRRGMAI